MNTRAAVILGEPHTVFMRMLGGDLVQPELGDDDPAPGRALVCPIPAGPDGATLGGVRVRLVNNDGATVTHNLDATPAGVPAVADWVSIIVVLASHPGDIRTAIDVGRISGWVPIALSPDADYERTGYAIGVGVSAS